MVGNDEGYATGRPHYIIGTVRFDMQKEEVTFENMQRHEDLTDTDLQGTAVMFKEYFKGRETSRYDDKNAFGFRRHDDYHEALDVACGYAGNSIAWMIIPHEAPTV